ncbi:MAG: glycosyltransferase [Anaerolineae bacterium]|nr:glycosyltransferase [Anaerolineae bacterium]
MVKSKNNDLVEIFEDVKKIKSLLPIQDVGLSFPKSFLIAYLIRQYDLVNYVELNVAVGQEFFAAAYSSAKQKGSVCFISSKQETEAHSNNRKTQLTSSHEAVEQVLSGHSFFENINLIWGDVQSQANFLQGAPRFDVLNIVENKIDMIDAHIDDLILAVKETGFVAFDTACSEEIHASLKRLRKNYATLYLNKTFSVVRLGFEQKDVSALETGKLDILYSLAENMENLSEKPTPAPETQFHLPLVSVIVISYNQEKFIADGLLGIFAQRGDLRVELVISDDASQDSTGEIIQNYVRSFGELVTVKIISSDHNVGMTRNFQRSLAACTGDFIAVCEGDDYWLDPLKLQKQVRFLQANQDYAICFNRIYMYFQNTEEFSVYEPNTKFDGKVLNTRDLVKEYFIGNLSCCMYAARYKEQISADLFDLFIGDWMFNIYYSQFGRIGCIEEFMSVYRKHDDGVWSTGDPHKNAKKLYGYLSTYNRYLNYEFNEEFSEIQHLLKLAVDTDVADLVVLDDVAPHPLSAFRLQEFLSYMERFENSILYCSGTSVRLLGNKTLDELIYNFLKKYPKYAGQINTLKPKTGINAKLAYMVFLGNAYLNVVEMERTGTPFVFCLYPGGSFALNNARSDEMLRRVTSSPCFRRVIVTQKITYDYLIEKKFCGPDQIEFIFGVVTPLEQFERTYVGKRHFGINKDILDICFVAHKYTETGVDKGYDVFVQVANVLTEKHPNIRFHVVGGFDENILDVSQIKDKITFYGSHETKWFDDFYLDKDLILSPNIPFKIFEGSFDGFPTGSCTDAGLRETAIFCTDELKLNQGFFEDEREIVVIPYDVMKIVDKIEYYYLNPEKLFAIGKYGRQKIIELYSYEAQIAPRVKLLQDEIDAFKKNKHEIISKKFEMFEEDISYLGF